MTFRQAVGLHAALYVASGLLDAVLAPHEWGYGVFGLAVEVFVLWRIWRRGRITWWVVAVLNTIAVALYAAAILQPAVLGYPENPSPVARVALLLIGVAMLALWVSPGVRRHVFVREPALP